MKSINGLIVWLITLLFWPLAAGATPYTNLYVFGDSLSDTGNMYAATAGGIPPSPFYVNGRSSNGPLWVEDLSPQLGLSYQPTNNYAWVGATTGHENAWNVDFPLAGFPGMADEIGTYFGDVGGIADPNALYVVWAGPNDFLGITDPGLVSAAVADGVTNVATAVGTLASMGAQHFLVPTMPDLGLTPRAGYLGLSSELGVVSSNFNGYLADAMLGLGRDYGLDIIMPDVAGLMQDIVADPTSFGLSNATDECFSDLMLAMGMVPTICSNPDEHLFWDTVHPTAAGHAVIASLFADALSVPEPASWALLLIGSLILIPTRRRQGHRLPN